MGRVRAGWHFLREEAEGQSPFATISQINDAMQTRLVVGELPFVNDQAGFKLSFENLRMI